MPPARSYQLIAPSLSKLTLYRANRKNLPRERHHHHPSSFRRLSSNNSIAAEHDDVEDIEVEGQTTASRPTITSEKEGRISPLIRLASAVIRYPPPSTNSNKIEFDYGLNDDCNETDGNILLESQPSFHDGDATTDQRQKNQQHLQRMHWNNTHQSATVTISHRFDPFDLNIWPNLECGSGGGGHVILGRNASGKTLLSRSLIHNNNYNNNSSVVSNNTTSVENNNTDNNSENDNNIHPYLHSGQISIQKRNPTTNRNHHFLSSVSFDSHSSLLLDPNTTTVHRALIPSGGNRLSPTAKFLSVRLGMYPLLPRYVHTLSTGEIRRVLLVRALVSKPEVLVLDNAFDGLDVRGREGLRDVVDRVLEGFRMDILVQGVGEAGDTARTQVVLSTHRPEEIVDGVGRVTFVDRMMVVGEEDEGGVTGSITRSRVRTEDRMGRDGDELVRSLGLVWEGGDGLIAGDNDDGGDVGEGNRDEYGGLLLPLHPWDMVSVDELPNDAEIADFWEYGKSRNGHVLVQANNLKVTCEGTTLLSGLNWTVGQGERWHLAGTNGAGKSTLARLLLCRSMNDNNINAVGSSIDSPNKDDALISDGTLVVATPSMTSSSPDAALHKRGGVGWVSTELHLHAAHNWGDRTALEILTRGASFLFHVDKHDAKSLSSVRDDDDVAGRSSMVADIAVTAARWLGLLDVNDRSSITTTNHPPSFLSRKFSTLSQGEQKLLLVASVLAQRPSILVLDEPCQGLDLWNRGHLLGLVEKICRVTDMSLLYVTHHEEELIPSIGHRLCLEDGKVTYCGSR